MGAVMKVVTAQVVAGRADGKRVSDEVRRQLRRLTPATVSVVRRDQLARCGRVAAATRVRDAATRSGDRAGGRATGRAYVRLGRVTGLGL